MLTIKPIKSAADASLYYSAKDNYYLSDKGELEHATSWYGKGALALGLTGEVSPEIFLQLLEGRLPSGQQLGMVDASGALKHRPGTDITLSAPKSVSLLALVGGDKRLLEVHNKAVRETFAAIEKMAAEARITINGETTFEKTGNLVVSLFQHTTSRELDANLHDHGVILNMTERADGKWRALSSHSKGDKTHPDNGFRELLYNNQHYFGLIYNSSLAKGTCEVGFDIEVKDRYGNFEIVGLPEDYLKHTSKRRAQIVNRMHEKGFSSSKAAEKANLDTRKNKNEVDTVTLEKIWKKEAVKFGVDFESIIESSMQGRKGRITAPEMVKVSETAREAIDDALMQLSPYSTQIKHADLVRMAFTFARGTVHHEEIEQEIAERFADKRLEGEASSYYTSKAQIELEKSFIKQFKEASALGFKLETGQSGMAADVLRSEDRVVLIDVRGLTHEKELIEELVHTSEDQGLGAYVLHVGRMQTKLLSDSVSRDSSSIWKWLKNSVKGDLVQTVAGFQARYERYLARPSKKQDVVIVHDAQKLSYKELMSLESLTSQTQSKLVLLNNTRSTAGYCAGSPVKALKDAGFTARQSATHEKKLAFEIVQTKKAFEDLAAHYAELSGDVRQTTKIAALTNKDAAELTALVRARLKSEGIISLQSKDARVLSTETLSEVQKKNARFYDKGDEVTFNAYTREQSRFRVIGKGEGGIDLEDRHGFQRVLKPGSEEGFIVTKTKTIALSIGDALVAEKNIFLGRAGNLARGSEFSVSAISEAGITLVNNKTRLYFSNDELQDLALSHAYVRKPGQITGRAEKLLVAAEGYQVNKNNFGELGEFCSNIRLFTSDQNLAAEALKKEQISFSFDDVAHARPSLVYRDSRFSDPVIRKDLEYLSEVLAKNEQSLDPSIIASVAVTYATARMAEREAAFEHKALLQEAIVFALGKASIGEIERAIEEKAASGDLIHADTFWISKESLTLENSILENNRKGQNTIEPITNNERLLTLPAILTQGQKDAICMSLTTCDRFTTIQGLAGVGKTTMMQEIQTLANEKSFRVVGLAPMHSSKDEMIANGIEAITVAEFLTHDTPYDDKTLFIVDEVSMIGNQDYLAIQTKIKSVNGRCNFAGDMTQLQSPSSGIPHELTVKSKTQKTAFMEEIMRQNRNPVLKQAVYQSTSRDIKESFTTLASINPEDWVERNTALPFPKSSVIEVNCFNKETNKMDYSRIYQAIASDYLTRIPEHQKNTLVIAHTHEDRAEINALIREGLKNQGRIALDEVPTMRLARRSLEKAELLSILTYSPGDILRFDANYSVARKGDYFSVERVDKEQKRLHCLASDGTQFSINPAVIALKSRMSVYQACDARLASGDMIRLRLTDKKRGLIANKEYTVENVTKNSALLKNEEGAIELQLDQNKDAHWDYAYSTTAFGAQGATSTFVLALEMAKRQNATTHRANKIDITRPREQVTIYTENKNRLIERLEKFEGDKTSAIQVLEGAQAKEKDNASRADIKKERPTPVHAPMQNPKESSAHKYKQAPISAEDINHQLTREVEALAYKLLGNHNQKLQNGDNIRYGNKGSLSINLKTGLWYNFETGEKGNALQLISAQIGFTEFKETLAYARDFLNYKDDLQVPKSVVKSEKKPVEKESKNHKAYAIKLYKQSLPVEGTHAERYLKDYRNVTLVKHADIRFLPEIPTWHKDRKTATPALLSIAKDKQGAIHHVQVIRLDAMTGDKDQQSAIIKQTYGAVKDRTVVLNRESKSQTTWLTEGLETGLSLLEANPDARVETVLGKKNFLHVDPESLTKHVILCVDNDGDKTFDDKVVAKAAQRLIDAGKTVSLMLPEKCDDDFNAVLIKEGVAKIKQYMDATINAKTVFKQHEKTNKVLENSNDEDKIWQAKSMQLKNAFTNRSLSCLKSHDALLSIEKREENRFNKIDIQTKNKDRIHVQEHSIKIHNQRNTIKLLDEFEVDKAMQINAQQKLKDAILIQESRIKNQNPVQNNNHKTMELER